MSFLRSFLGAAAAGAAAATAAGAAAAAAADADSPPASAALMAASTSGCCTAYQAPDLENTPAVTPTSTASPAAEMPVPNIMSNSATRKGGAILFFTTFTRVTLPICSSPFLMAVARRISMRTEE